MKNNWKTKKVADCLEKIPSIGSVLSSQNLTEGKFPVIDQGQDFIAGYTNDESLIFSDCLPVIIFGDHTRALKFIDFPFAVGADGTKILKPLGEFDPKFFYYMLLSLDLGSRGYARHFKILKESEIPLPQLEIQKEIVAKLDEKMEKIKKAKKLREEALAYTEKILSQTLREIFEEGKQKGWEEVTVGDTCSLMTGATPSTARKEYYGGDIKWLVSGDIHNKEILDCDGRINELGVKNSNAKLLPKNSLLIALNGQGKTKGTVSILRVEATCNQSLVAIIPKIDVLVEYLYYCLNFQYKKIRGMAGNDSRKGLNMKIVREITFLLPSLSEQQKIVTKLDKLSEKIRTLRELQTSQLADLKRLGKSYLREAFNGELI